MKSSEKNAFTQRIMHNSQWVKKKIKMVVERIISIESQQFKTKGSCPKIYTKKKLTCSIVNPLTVSQKDMKKLSKLQNNTVIN